MNNIIKQLKIGDLVELEEKTNDPGETTWNSIGYIIKINSDTENPYIIISCMKQKLGTLFAGKLKINTERINKFKIIKKRNRR